MNRHWLLTCIVVFIFSGTNAQEDYSAWWQKGNSYYQQKNYDSAAAYYQKIADLEPGNAEVYYNLGNTYYRLNNIGAAVLNYERVLKLEPVHKQASDNLYLAQSRINNRIQEIPQIFFVRWWNTITKPTLANAYAIFAAILFLLALGYFIARQAKAIHYTAPVRLTTGILILCILFLGLGIASAKKAVAADSAVVMQDSSPLMAQPKYGKSQSQVPEGTKVQICNEKSGWYEVTLPDGRTGWLENTSVAKI
ncbi:MAG: tetratricopeptide repeat protein [Taibaiella sp.]|nr:tetratricopeptide repeat protein [Taibaiella sp.]